jgi:glycosyltransferase involved in cell wall biosynthesis
MCTHQARAGADVTLATCDDTDVPAEWRAGGPGVPKIAKLRPPGKLKGFEASFRKQFEPLVKSHDVIHLHVIWEPSQVGLAWAARDAGKPYVQSPHGMLADWSVIQKKAKKDLYWALFAKSNVDHASFIVLTAQGELDQSAKRHPKTPGIAIPLVFDTDLYRTCPTPGPARQHLKMPPAEIPSILYLSRLHYKKRPDLLIASARALRDLGAPDFRIVIGGPSDADYAQKLRDYAKSIKVDDITTFLGVVPAEHKPSVYNACDLFCLPTSMENFGFVYFEALACATAVVTTKGTDTWREIEQSGAGHIVEMIQSDVKDGDVGGGNVAQLAGVLHGLLKRRPELKPMGMAGREWVMKNMDPRVVVGKYLDMYQKAISGKRA